MFASVPTQIGIRSRSVMSAARMMCGVSVSITSVRLVSELDFENSLPRIGMSESPGIPVSPLV